MTSLYCETGGTFIKPRSQIHEALLRCIIKIVSWQESIVVIVYCFINEVFHSWLCAQGWWVSRCYPTRSLGHSQMFRYSSRILPDHSHRCEKRLTKSSCIGLCIQIHTILPIPQKGLVHSEHGTDSRTTVQMCLL